MTQRKGSPSISIKLDAGTEPGTNCYRPWPQDVIDCLERRLNDEYEFRSPMRPIIRHG